MKNEIKALAWMIPVGVLAFVVVALLDARLQPPAEHPMSVATACSPFDIACNAQEALDEQHGAGQSAAEEPVCREDGGNAYVCALPHRTRSDLCHRTKYMQRRAALARCCRPDPRPHRVHRGCASSRDSGGRDLQTHHVGRERAWRPRCLGPSGATQLIVGFLAPMLDKCGVLAGAVKGAARRYAMRLRRHP